MTCPGCPPHPPHAGRCFVIKDMAYCPCKQKREAPDVDRPSIPSQRGPGAAERPAGVPGGVAALAQRQLDAAGQTLVAVCTDLLGQINAIGDTMSTEAARLRGEGG